VVLRRKMTRVMLSKRHCPRRPAPPRDGEAHASILRRSREASTRAPFRARRRPKKCKSSPTEGQKVIVARYAAEDMAEAEKKLGPPVRP